MITLDTRLLKRWIVSLVAILLSSVEATVTTSCDIPSVDEGQQTKLTCMFSEDISRAQVDFKVELYSLDREPPSVPILDCVWFNGKLDCRVHSCCSFDRKVTDNATLVILNATQDLVGKYMCHVVPSSPGSSHFCNFTVNKIVSTGRRAAIGTDGVESNSFPVVPVVVGVVVPVVVVIAIIVILYMRRKGRYRNELRDNIPKEDNSSGNEYSRRQHLTIENHALEERKSEVDPPLKKSEVSPLLKKSEVDSLLEKSEVSPLLEKSEVSPLLKKSEVYPLLEKSEVSPLLKKSEVDSLLEKSEISPLLEKSEVSPQLEKSEVSPLLEKSEVSPLLKKSEVDSLLEKSEVSPQLEKSEVSPLLEKSEVSPLLEKSESPLLEKSEVSPLLEKYEVKSESLYFDTTDSNNASDTGNEKYPKETGGFVQKSTNNPGPLTDSVAEDVIETRNIPAYFKYNDGKDYSKDSTAERRRNLFKYSQQSEKMTEAKHSDTTNAETEEINLTSDIKPVSPKEDENCSFLQDTTTSQGDLNGSRFASMKPDSGNSTPCLPNLKEGAHAVPDNAEMDSHNTPSHTLPFSDANPTIKEEFTVNDKDSRLCSLAAQDPLVNATNGNHTEASEKTEDWKKAARDRFAEMGEFPD